MTEPFRFIVDDFYGFTQYEDPRAFMVSVANAKIAPLLKAMELMREALRSISKESCCIVCQCAACDAKGALDEVDKLLE